MKGEELDEAKEVDKNNYSIAAQHESAHSACYGSRTGNNAGECSAGYWRKCAGKYKRSL